MYLDVEECDNTMHRNKKVQQTYFFIIATTKGTVLMFKEEDYLKKSLSLIGECKFGKEKTKTLESSRHIY